MSKIQRKENRERENRVHVDGETAVSHQPNVPQQLAHQQILDNVRGGTSVRAKQAKVLQRQLGNRQYGMLNQPVQKKKNDAGLPDNLKGGIEALSGLSMDDVNVHYNSTKPAQVDAYAYAQGTDIHLASGQEKHLPHEAWHVVQQKQGRVKPTLQLQDGIPINDSHELESEATVMGKRASIMSSPPTQATVQKKSLHLSSENAIQRWPQITTASGNFTYELGVDFQSRHVAASRDDAIALARELYDPNHSEGSHSAYVTVIYGDITAVNAGTDAVPKGKYHWALTIDVAAVCMGPSGGRGANGDPGQMDDGITSVTVSGYGDGTAASPAKITHVSTSL